MNENAEKNPVTETPANEVENKVAAPMKMKKLTAKFSAVDLITCVVFAVLVRVLWIVFKMIGVVFPFNHSFMSFFMTFCLVTCIAVVKKRWAAVYYTIGWICINFFLQGEIPHYFIGIIIFPLFSELYLAWRSKAFDNPTDVYHSFKDQFLSALVYETIYFWFTFEIAIKRVFLIPVDMTLVLLAFGGAVIFCALATYLGLKIGKRLNVLIK